MTNNKKIGEVIIGRLGRDPELKYTLKSEPVCNFSLAIEGEDSIKPIWKRIVVWGKLAETCSVHLKKGVKVFVQGPSEWKSFKLNNGETKTYEEVCAREIGFTLI